MSDIESPQGNRDRVDRHCLLLLGASGHATVVCDVIACGSHFVLVGILDPRRTPGEAFGGSHVLGSDDDAARLAAETGATHAFVAIGDNDRRERLSVDLRRSVPGISFATLVHPRAVIAAGARLGAGVVVMAGAVVNSGAEVAEGCIVNTGATLDHDARMGRFSSLGPGASVGGNVQIGEGSAVAIGATVVHNLSIGAHTVVGAGSVVTRDVPSGVVTFGVPARVVRARARGDRYL